MNRLVHEYLLESGRTETAKAFQAEVGLQDTLPSCRSLGLDNSTVLSSFMSTLSEKLEALWIAELPNDQPPVSFTAISYILECHKIDTQMTKL